MGLAFEVVCPESFLIVPTLVSGFTFDFVDEIGGALFFFANNVEDGIDLFVVVVVVVVAVVEIGFTEA